MHDRGEPMRRFRNASKLGLLLSTAMIVGGVLLIADPNRGPVFRPGETPHSSGFIDRSPPWAVRAYGVMLVLVGFGAGALSLYDPRR